MAPHWSDSQNLTVEDPQADLLRWHYRLGHAKFTLLKHLVRLDILPRRLATAKVPKCASCLCGAMTKKPWRHKGSKCNVRGYRRKIDRPGQCASVDQMESAQIGFMAQLKGALTRQRYTGAMVFVDHHSRLKYVHLTTSTSSQQTVYAKESFERHCRHMDVHIQHYHCDNG